VPRGWEKLRNTAERGSENSLKNLAVMKFGGSLLDFSGTNIPLMVKRIREMKEAKDLGPLAVFSAPFGVTDRLQEIGEAKALGRGYDLNPIFTSFLDLASNHARKNFIKEFQSQLGGHRRDVEETLLKIDRRFNGSIRAKVLTSGGEIPTAVLMSYILNSRNLESCYLGKRTWPIVTDDSFENAMPDYELSRKRLSGLLGLIDGGGIVCIPGFLGLTHDGLETVLGRGGSDQTAVFLSCLLRDRYEVETILLKETPVQSADPKIVKDQELRTIPVMTYNEAQKATVSGMTIVQNAAVRLARSHKLPVTVAPISDLGLGTVIQAEDLNPMIVKCVTGLDDCAMITMNNERSRSLEDCLRLWEGYDGFLDLGAEVMDTGEVVRDFLVLDANFVRRNEKQLRSFDREMRVEYGIGIVTLIGDKMSTSSGIASAAIRSIPDVNIRRGVFAPHTSQIILVLDEKDISKAVKAIHHELRKINRL